MDKTKSYEISKDIVLEAFKRVKENKGAAGIDDESIAAFESKLNNNLYKIWNRMSSGSYFPSAVKAIEIPKKSGGTRVLGVPTVYDRIAQMVAKIYFEPQLEPHFHPDSYGYRPSKSAADALTATRKRCWKYNWLLEFDIRGLFDNIDHELLLKAVRMHTDKLWVILYIQRWLTAPFQMPDGTIKERTKGTRREELSVLFWQICFSTMLLICGWLVIIRIIHLFVMLMMLSSTAEAKRRQKSYGLNWKNV
jgi:RNA-directed DNA polymerase